MGLCSGKQTEHTNNELHKVTSRSELEEEVLKSKYNRQQLLHRIKDGHSDVDRTRKKLSMARSILQELCDLYEATEGNCPCCRQGELDTIVRGALADHTKKVSGIESGDYDPMEEKAKLLNPMGRLLLHSRSLSTVEHERAELEARLADMNNSQLQEELITHLSIAEGVDREFSAVEAHFKQLARAYQRSLDYNFCKRYTALKHMIEDATINCLRDSDISMNS